MRNADQFAWAQFTILAPACHIRSFYQHVYRHLTGHLFVMFFTLWINCTNDSSFSQDYNYLRSGLGRMGTGKGLIVAS